MKGAAHHVRLMRLPVGAPREEDFLYEACPMPQPAAGQFLSRTLFLSLDPYYRNVMKNLPIYPDRLAPGDVMIGETVAEVVESRHREYSRGDIVAVRNGWRTHALSDGKAARKLDPGAAPVSTALGVLGVPGLTGYAGVLRLAEPRAGETFVVSAAVGPVGSTAGQVAARRGMRVVGIAGSEEKCEFAMRELRFAGCVNHRAPNFAEALKAACPDGIHAYFDNVGGDVLAVVLRQLALKARVVLCGMIGAYNLDAPPPGPWLGPVVGARATLKGLVVYDHLDLMPEMEREIVAWIRAGEFRYREDISEGLASAPAAFCRLMRGENFGKALVRLQG